MLGCLMGLDGGNRKPGEDTDEGDGGRTGLPSVCWLSLAGRRRRKKKKEKARRRQKRRKNQNETNSS